MTAGVPAAGLTVIHYTLRQRTSSSPTSLRVGTNLNDFGNGVNEDVTHVQDGVGGLFCDQPDISAMEARKSFLAG